MPRHHPGDRRPPSRHTFEPDLVVSDGDGRGVCAGRGRSAARRRRGEAWTCCPSTRSSIWCGTAKRHIMMNPDPASTCTATANISAIGDQRAAERAAARWSAARRENTVYHPTSYWVPKHSTRVFVPKVDMVSGVGKRQRAQGGSGDTPVPRIAPCRHGSGGPRLHAGHRPAAPGLPCIRGVTVDDVVRPPGSIW